MKRNKILVPIVVPAMLAAAVGGGYYAYLLSKAQKPVVTYSDEGTVITRKQAAVAPDTIDEVVVEEQEPVSEQEDDELPDIELPFAAEYFLQYLSEDEAVVCRQLYSGLKNFDDVIHIKRGTVSSDEICDLIVMCVTSSPEIDYLDPNYSVTVDADGFVTEVDVTYTLDPDDVRDRLILYNWKLKDICAGIDPEWSDFEKFKHIHDRIVNSCRYEEDDSDSYTAYGCLVKGKAVCEGYSKALMLACNEAGIEILPVVGQGVDDEGGSQGHIWNKVKLDGEWYNTDITWDDPIFQSAEDYIRYDFFAVTDEISDKNHIADENRFFTLPECKSSDDDYFVHNGYYIEDEDGIYEAMRKAVLDTMAEGGDFARVRCADSSSFEACVDRAFSEGTGSEDVFGILKEGAESYIDENYSVSGYSVINNSNTGTVTLRLRRQIEAEG